MSSPRVAPLPSTKKYRILAQDPSVRDATGAIITAIVEIPYEEVDPGPKGARVHVIDFDASLGVFYPPTEINPATTDRWLKSDSKQEVDKLIGSREFRAYNAYAIVMRTLARFEFALGRRLSWSFDGHQLHVAPHAFADANAFYSKRDRGLFCGYFQREGKTIYTCLSHDVLAHETTHALLDGLRQRYTEPSSPQQAAFHEGFADVVALLSIFSLPSVVEKCIDLKAREIGGRPDRVSGKLLNRDFLGDSVLLGLGDEMGATLDRQALRRSVKITPKEGKATLKKNEPHDLGEVLVAAVMSAFLDVWVGRLATLGELPGGGIDRGRAAEEGRIAADHLLTMVIRAIDYAPPVDIRFYDFLSALLTSDLEIQPTDRFNYREHLLNNFRRYGIEPTSKGFGSYEGVWEPPEETFDYSNTVLENMQRDDDEVFRFMWQNRDRLALYKDAYTRVQSIRPCIRMSSEGFVLRETVAEYIQILDIQARDLDRLPWHVVGKKKLLTTRPAGMPPRTHLRLYGGGALIFSDRGELKYHVRNRILNPDRQRERLANLWKAGELGEPADTDRRFSQMHRLRALGGTESPFATEDSYAERF
jgi:hypothetical protein